MGTLVAVTGRIFSPDEPPRPRRRLPSPNRLPLTATQLRARHVARLLARMNELLEEYEWTHAMAYGPASTGGSGTRGDVAYSDPAAAIALRGANSVIRDGGAPAEGERDQPALSALRRALLDTERRIEQAESALNAATIVLRKATRSGSPAKQLTDHRKGIGAATLKESLDAKQRREARGEGKGEG